MNTPTAPEHVPRRLVTDFDYQNIPGHEEDVHLAWSRVHAFPDIFWTPRHGGHWVATRAEDIDVMQVDHRRFSLRSITIPPTPGDHVRLAPLEYDPPEHTPLRAVLSPAFGPKPMQMLEGDVRVLTRQLLDKMVPAGSCEFITDFAKVLPIVTFLRLVDLPLADRDRLLALTDMVTRPPTDEERGDAFLQLKRYTERWIIERRERPGPDLFSRIVNARIAGQPLDDTQTEGMLSTVLFGGLDTVASTLGFVFRCLAEEPGVRDALLSEPKLIPVAIEEFLRRFAIPNTARVITHDFDYKGLHFKEGEHILIPRSLHGLDERRFEDPLRIRLDRPRSSHAGFGDGPHRCPGSFLARLELRVFLEEWLARIPNFEITKGRKPRTIGSINNGITFLPLTWVN